MVLALVMATMGILAALGLVASIVRPLQSLRAAIDRIAAGDFAVVVAPGGPSEIREIGEALAGMAESLAQMRSAPAPAVPAGTRSIGSRLLLRRT
jgi:nitrate/nitrite-specific signal transduction histidine kinase